MGKYWQLLGQYDAETNTFSALAVTGMASPYTPVEDARLTGLRVVPNRSAVTTLMNHVQFRLTHSAFKPNTIEVGGQGSGLQTAPVSSHGHSDWDVDQPVKAGVPIAIEARNITTDTPVTVSVLLYGRFEN